MLWSLAPYDEEFSESLLFIFPCEIEGCAVVSFFLPKIDIPNGYCDNINKLWENCPSSYVVLYNLVTVQIDAIWKKVGIWGFQLLFVGRVSILIATDVASRGLDIKDIRLVVFKYLFISCVLKHRKCMPGQNKYTADENFLHIFASDEPGNKAAM